MTSGLWCSSCGYPAELLAPSLDPAHPLVLCQRTRADGELAHPSPRPGVRDTDELAAIMREHRAQREREAHRRHTDRLAPKCRLCAQLAAQGAAW